MPRKLRCQKIALPRKLRCQEKLRCFEMGAAIHHIIMGAAKKSIFYIFMKNPPISELRIFARKEKMEQK